MESTDKRTSAEEFVTVVNVQGTQPPTPSSAESFVTVLSIGTGTKQQNKLSEQTTVNGVDPAHPEEEVEVYRLPGERLGFGLKFEGGNKTSEKVRRLFIQSCAEQSPASRAKCSWGNLGEGDEVLSIDEVPVTEMTRLDCVRRLKESQLVIKLAVRCRGALRPEVVSAERKLQQRSKVPPELPAAPPPVPPRKLRRDLTQAAVNRGLADGEASPGMKKASDSPKSTGSSNTGSPQSQASFRSAASSIRSSNYESCVSSPVKSGPGSKSESPKDSPKVHVSPVLNKIKQEPPAEAQSYLDARSQDGSSTHGSTSDDTSSSLSTVVDRFSSSDRFSTTSTTSTTSEQLVVPPTEIDVNGDALLLSNGVCMDLSNPSDFLLTRLANSEARTHDDAEIVEKVVNGEAPPLPARNHVNRIPINQQEPPKPMPRKELKAKRKRPPPPPPPPRREPPPPVPEARNVEVAKKKKENGEAKKENTQAVTEEESEPTQTNKVLEIVEMKKVKSLSPMKPPSRISDEYEVPSRGVEASGDGDVETGREQGEIELRNSINRTMLADMSNSSTVSMDVEVDSDEEKRLEKKEDVVQVVEEVYEETMEVVVNGQDVSQMDEGSRVDEELAAEMRIVDRRRNDEKNLVNDEDVSDESDGDDYYWQSNLATIGEEEENNSLEYEDAYVTLYFATLFET
ncbi:hypothetical protein TSAR_000293 [Trichomalopsis sarcophagae]|uniref:PDZ domain-containing protein n=1 Tax=Trichomalopsis sarcophagae TaxID=543379 RepID=A0A232FFE8_9HYME|nr:hypothetical protein TSAR_000293 [Trichomalopsis sarcophagae]